MGESCPRGATSRDRWSSPPSFPSPPRRESPGSCSTGGGKNRGGPWEAAGSGWAAIPDSGSFLPGAKLDFTEPTSRNRPKLSPSVSTRSGTSDDKFQTAQPDEESTSFPLVLPDHRSQCWILLCDVGVRTCESSETLRRPPGSSALGPGAN